MKQNVGWKAQLQLNFIFDPLEASPLEASPLEASPPEKLPHEMTDEELRADEASREAAARLFGGITPAPVDDDDGLEDEDVDASGDLLERISATDYRSLREYLDEELDKSIDLED